LGPKGGKVIELGCGTGPVLRWICKGDFSGLGIDVSKTAIAMAREQSKGLNVKFKQADICRTDVGRTGKFDLAIDGHCLHCIIRPEDRKAFLKNSFKLLKKGGLFIVMTMCSPADKRIFSNVCEGQKLINHTIYAPYDKAREYEDFLTFNGRDYMPTRKVLHWKSILSEIQKAGFKIKLLRYNEASGQEDPFGCLSVAALT
jgi:SAM-dependent methyltransferase